MNILIITTAFPPDTAIAAVRPFMFAKYLQKAGHRVTVLRSGEIYNKTDRALDYTKLGIRVESYLGKQCEAERFMRDELTSEIFRGKRKMANFPEMIRKPLAWCYRRLDFFYKLWDTKTRFVQQKKWIDAHSQEHFDVVFATYSSLENVYAGRYASEVFGCKWILDLRDPIAQASRDKLWEYLYYKKIQKEAVRSADLCTVVSHDVAQNITVETGEQIVTLYNGFDEAVGVPIPSSDDGILRFCYTGVMYEQRSASALFSVIKQLVDAGKMDLDKVRVDYAGPHFEVLLTQARAYDVEKILVDHGYVVRDEVYKIQCRSDIFLVLSWNTQREKGVLTGKFYEGIRARKPILSLVSGDVPNSELKVINEKYHYGLCYEECQEKETFDDLRIWVEEAYQAKQTGKLINNQPEPTLFTDFCYENLTKQLEKHMQELQNSQKADFVTQCGMRKCYFIHESSVQKDKTYLGVQKKINEQISVLSERVHVEPLVLKVRVNDTVSKILKRIPFGPSGYCWKELTGKIENPDILYIRKPLADRGFNAFLKKVRRKYPQVKILLELPTYPYDKELFSSAKNMLMYPAEVFYRNRLRCYIDRIVTLTEDKEIFGIPTISIQNGVNVKDHPIRNFKTDTAEIHLIAVATFQKYHGYERIIKGLADYYYTGGKREIVLDMVGGGDEVKEYKKLSTELGIQDRIVFWGPQYKENLQQRINEADIGLGTFGLYKIGIHAASSLKVREYLAGGLPVIAGSKQDLLSEENFPYYLEFPNDDTSLDMERIVKFYDRIYCGEEHCEEVIRNIRAYAEENVTWKKTFTPVLDYITNQCEV